MAEPVLSVSHLSRSFPAADGGTVRAVDDISLSVATGEVYGLVGPDGAGKTTTLRLVCGALKPDSGSVTICGYALDRQPENARAQIGYLSQHFSLYEDLSVLENVRFLAEVRSMQRGDWLPRSRANLDFVGLGAFEDRLAGQLSGGMKQKLALACALVNRPRLLLLDEPTTGVDPVTRQDFWQLVIRLAGEQGIAVVVCTPYMDEATRCLRVGFLRQGKIFQEGTPSQLRERLRGQVMELAGSPTEVLLQLARRDADVRDVQRFGERFHLRIKPGQAAAVQSRLAAAIEAEGGQVQRLAEITPLLEDVFISLTQEGGEPLLPLHGGNIETEGVSRLSAPSTVKGGAAVSSGPVIAVKGLTRRFGNFTAVDNITFSIEPGQVIGYLGPNGSGKTTTIRMLLGLLRPSEGTAQVLGFDATRQSMEVRARTGYMSQKFSLYHELTVRENLVFYAGVYGVPGRQRVDQLLEQLGLSAVSRQPVRTLPGGWRQRLALATAIVHRPQLLLLDEPTSGVDPNARRSFWELIYSLVAEGITILVTTHYMEEAEYCGIVGILNEGRLLALDTPTRLKESLPGRMWEIFIRSDEPGQPAPLLPALDCLAAAPGILRASLSGDHLRAMAAPNVRQEDLEGRFAAAGISPEQISPTQAAMEDAFMSFVAVSGMHSDAETASRARDET